MKAKNELASGWACEPHCGVYRFGHVATKIAEQISTASTDDHVYVVVTINWTLASGTKKDVHRNHYFALSPLDAAAIALAVNHPNEDVVEIRRATAAEAREYIDAWGHFHDRMPAAIPLAPRTAALPRKRER